MLYYRNTFFLHVKGIFPFPDFSGIIHKVKQMLMEIYGKSYCYNAGCYSVPKTECASFFFLKKKGDISISQLQLKAYTIRQDKPQFKSMEKS